MGSAEKWTPELWKTVSPGHVLGRVDVMDERDSQARQIGSCKKEEGRFLGPRYWLNQFT